MALIELLKPLGVPDKPHGKEFRALSRSGRVRWATRWSTLWPRPTPDVHDGTVLVADSLDGKPLADDGPLKLIATGEKRPARWVRNLVSIRVQAAE